MKTIKHKISEFKWWPAFRYYSNGTIYITHRVQGHWGYVDDEGIEYKVVWEK